MAGYIGSGASVVSSGAERKKVFDITTNTTSLTGLNYTVGKVHVYHNGVRLVDGTDYTATNSTSITLTVAAVSGDQVVVVSYASFQLSEHYTSAEADAEFVAKSTTGNLTLDVSGILNLDSAFSSGTTGGIIRLKDAGTQFGDLYEDSGNFLIASAQVDKDIIFKGNDGGSIITPMTIDMSAGGNVGIGTSSPSAPLQVAGTTNGLQSVFGLDSSGLKISTFQKTGNDAGVILDAQESSNGTLTFATTGSERMRIDSSGAVTKPSQPAFLVTLASKQSNVAVNSAVTVDFDTEIFDQNADFNLGANTFTAPVTGRYQLNLSLYTNEIDSAADYYMAVIKTSNREYQNVIDPGVLASDPVYWNQGVSVLADMDANDIAYAFIQQGNGNQQTDVATPTLFSGYLVA